MERHDTEVPPAPVKKYAYLSYSLAPEGADNGYVAVKAMFLKRDIMLSIITTEDASEIRLSTDDARRLIHLLGMAVRDAKGEKQP